jgi:hypothetical protein
LTSLEVTAEEKQGRWSTGKKAEAVLRLLRGELADTECRECKITLEVLTHWRDEFVNAGIAGLKGKSPEQAQIRLQIRSSFPLPPKPQ